MTVTAAATHSVVTKWPCSPAVWSTLLGMSRQFFFLQFICSHRVIRPLNVSRFLNELVERNVLFNDRQFFGFFLNDVFIYFLEATSSFAVGMLRLTL